MICATIKPLISVNIRQLRDTRQLKTWLQAGKTVELRERNHVIGHIVPERSFAGARMWPDFAERTTRVSLPEMTFETCSELARKYVARLGA